MTLPAAGSDPGMVKEVRIRDLHRSCNGESAAKHLLSAVRRVTGERSTVMGLSPSRAQAGRKRRYPVLLPKEKGKDMTWSCTESVQLTPSTRAGHSGAHCVEHNEFASGFDPTVVWDQNKDGDRRQDHQHQPDGVRRSECG
jgi:hypothetical protein